jgi:hypothetical protein
MAGRSKGASIGKGDSFNPVERGQERKTDYEWLEPCGFTGHPRHPPLSPSCFQHGQGDRRFSHTRRLPGEYWRVRSRAAQRNGSYHNKRRLACQCRCVSGHQGTPSMSLKATLLHVNNAFHRTTAKEISPVMLGTHTATRHEYNEKYRLSACITYTPVVNQALRKVFQASPSWSRAIMGFT